MRFSSAKIRRIGSVEKMSRKIPELTPTAVMNVPLQKWGSSVQNARAAVHGFSRARGAPGAPR
jgi:hypothetical protein